MFIHVYAGCLQEASHGVMSSLALSSSQYKRGACPCITMTYHRSTAFPVMCPAVPGVVRPAVSLSLMLHTLPPASGNVKAFLHIYPQFMQCDF